MRLFEKTDELISTFNVESITESRKQILDPLIDFIQQKTDKKEEIRLNFICTHNSRRSHFAQVWAQTMAHYFLSKMYSAIRAGRKQRHCSQSLPKHLKNQDLR